MAEVNNLVVVSDLHCGCRMGLCPSKPVPLDDGGTYTPSKYQKIVYQWWGDFWGKWVPRVCRNEPFDVCVNGDSMDGVHHGSTTQISQNLEDQADIAYELLAPIAEKCERLYIIRGTEAHVGKSGVEEERLAKRLSAVRDETGRYARWELWKEVGDGLCHILHHIGTTGRQAYETSAVQAELVAEFSEAGQSGERPPDFVIRSHRHRFIAVDNPGINDRAVALVTPGWQLKTPFVYKIPGGRVSPPQFGGIVIRQGDEDVFYRRKVYKLQRGRVER